MSVSVSDTTIGARHEVQDFPYPPNMANLERQKHAFEFFNLLAQLNHVLMLCLPESLYLFSKSSSVNQKQKFVIA